MANYALNPDVLKPYLPPGVELNFYYNKTYVSLVGFLFRQTSLLSIPIPFWGTFDEIPNNLVSADGFVALNKANALAFAGLDAYYETTLIGRLAFARPFQPKTKLPD